MKSKAAIIEAIQNYLINTHSISSIKLTVFTVIDEDSAYFEEDPCLRIVNINNVVSLHISDDNIVMCIDDNLSILNFVIPISDPECLTKIVDLIVI